MLIKRKSNPLNPRFNKKPGVFPFCNTFCHHWRPEGSRYECHFPEIYMIRQVMIPMDIRKYGNCRVICLKYTPKYIACQADLGHILRIIQGIIRKYFKIIQEYSLDKVEIQTYIITGCLHCDHIKIFLYAKPYPNL